MKTPVLQTERLILRPLTTADAETVYSGWASDPEVNKYMVYVLHRSVSETIEWLKQVEADLNSSDSYLWGFVIRESGQLIGSGGLNFNKGHEMFEVGYNIMKAHWNKGYTSEAMRAAIDFAARELGAVRFYGRHSKDNVFSGKVMEKLGFIYQKDGETAKIDDSSISPSREYLLNITN
ncbi:MAG: GNAT family N-acetyltransferase [Oscillospiraceae bacterium]|nr:GNAT family N-acetyltransferase [Oscillospiraceae bacterium]